MHCDDKRTIFALNQFMVDSELDLQKAKNQLKTENDDSKRLQIQSRIHDLQKSIKDSKDQLLTMQ